MRISWANFKSIERNLKIKVNHILTNSFPKIGCFISNMFLINIPFKGCQGCSNHSSIVHAVSYFAYGANDTFFFFLKSLLYIKKNIFTIDIYKLQIYKWHRMHRACGVNDTACIMHAVSMTLHALCMRCQWHCMHRACGVIDIAFLIFFAYHRCFAYDFHFSKLFINFLGHAGVNYTAGTMHAVLMTPHAPCMRYQWYRMHKKIFAQLWKVKIICKRKTRTLQIFANSNY
jgi:hypothetical protein